VPRATIVPNASSSATSQETSIGCSPAPPPRPSHRLVIEPHRPADRLGDVVVDVAFLLLFLAAASILATLVVLIIVLG